MVSQKKVPQTRAEEFFNSLTHGLGLGLAIAALVILVSLSDDAWKVVSFSVYGACLVALYLASTLYHAFTSPLIKRFMRMLDHSAIFLLIAGSYTPITLVAMRGAWGWTLFGLIWGFALVGLVLELSFMDRLRWLTLTTYVGMGWLVVIAVKPLVAALPMGGLLWLGAGGLFYTGGIVFYLWKSLPFNHGIWHLFVLGGSISHFFCFLFYILPNSV